MRESAEVDLLAHRGYGRSLVLDTEITGNSTKTNRSPQMDLAISDQNALA